MQFPCIQYCLFGEVEALVFPHRLPNTVLILVALLQAVKNALTVDGEKLVSCGPASPL